MNVNRQKLRICLVCAKPSFATICDSCAARIRGEALTRKKKEEKI